MRRRGGPGGRRAVDRVDRIWRHETFRRHLAAIRERETDRKFGKHDLAHFLDVARIGEIMNLESGLGLDRELIYAAALLHDIGRDVEYDNGTEHDLAGAQIAPEILRDCGFDPRETEQIADAIRSHGDETVAGENSLRGVLYRADKASRACFACDADVRRECRWSEEKKNLKIRY